MYEYEICPHWLSLDNTIDKINENEYKLVSVTQDSDNNFVVFYKKA